MVDIPQDQSVAPGLLDRVTDVAWEVGQGLIDLAAFGVVAGLLWVQLPHPVKPQPAPVAVATCEEDCIAIQPLASGS